MKHPPPRYPSVRKMGTAGPGKVCIPRIQAKLAATYSPAPRAVPTAPEMGGGTRAAVPPPLPSAAGNPAALAVTPPARLRHPTRTTSTSALVIDAEPRVRVSPALPQAPPTEASRPGAPPRDEPQGRFGRIATAAASLAFAACLLWRVAHPVAVGPQSAGGLAPSVAGVTTAAKSLAAGTSDRLPGAVSPEPPSAFRGDARELPPPPRERTPSGGTLRVTVGGHRVFIDGRLVGEGAGSFPVSPGKHEVLVGSMGQIRAIDVARGDEVVVETTGWQQAEDLAVVETPWAPYKDAWACALPAGFAEGRLGTPPNFGADEASLVARHQAWLAARSAPGARSSGNVGVFLSRADGGWLFVPGASWSPYDPVFLPHDKAAAHARKAGRPAPSGTLRK
jgi:hypothetical protein